MLIGIDANEANIKNRVGSNQFAYTTLKQLYDYDQTNQYIIYLKKPPLKSLPPSRKNFRYLVLSPGFLWTQWRLPLSLYLSRPRPDVFLTLGHYAPRFSPIPLAFAIMDLAFLKFPQQFLKKDLYKLKNWTKYSALKADHLFTISHHTKKDIQKYYQIPSDKITVTYPTVKPIKTINTPSYKNYLLYLGTLQPRKNINSLIQAFADVVPERPDLKLIIAGQKGWLYQDLFTQSARLKLDQKVIFTGFVKEFKIAPLIKGAKALILPSLYEGFGIPVVHSMLAGTPVVVSNNSSLKEIVANSGILIKAPFQAKQIKQGIIQLLNLNKDQKKQLIQRAQIQAQKFTKSNAKTILEVLNDISL